MHHLRQAGASTLWVCVILCNALYYSTSGCQGQWPHDLVSQLGDPAQRPNPVASPVVSLTGSCAAGGRLEGLLCKCGIVCPGNPSQQGRAREVGAASGHLAHPQLGQVAWHPTLAQAGACWGGAWARQGGAWLQLSFSPASPPLAWPGSRSTPAWVTGRGCCPASTGRVCASCSQTPGRRRWP